MREQQPTQDIRKPYVKPMVEQVRLALDEAILGTGCKNSGFQGPGATPDCGFPDFVCTEPLS
jgi:hypothetical protein